MRIQISQQQLLQRVSQTATTLQSLLPSLSSTEWRWRPQAGEWSVTEIICHLRDVDREIHLPRILSLINQDDPFMPGVASDDWAIERNYQAQDGPEALNEFLTGRAELMSNMPPIGNPLWERRGRHTFFGPTSFYEITCLVAEHDELHVEQVKNNLAALAVLDTNN